MLQRPGRRRERHALRRSIENLWESNGSRGYFNPRELPGEFPDIKKSLQPVDFLMLQRTRRRRERHTLRRCIENLAKALFPDGIIISGNFRASTPDIQKSLELMGILMFQRPRRRRERHALRRPFGSLGKAWVPEILSFPKTSGRVSGYLEVAITLGIPYVSATPPPPWTTRAPAILRNTSGNIGPRWHLNSRKLPGEFRDI